jgi:hypothetical protein
VAQNKTARKSGGKVRNSTRSAKKSGTSRSARAGATHRGEAATMTAGDEEVSLDRRRAADRRDDESAAERSTEAAPQLERRKKVNRRRQIDPTTCERDYTEDEVEFMNALDDYKRKSGRMFPTCSEVLEVIRGLGYVKVPSTELAAMQGTCASATSAKPMPTNWNASTPSDQLDSDDDATFGCESQDAF